jgi:TPR repeat protein
MGMRTTIGVAVASAAMVVAAIAGPLEDANKALNQKDYATALRLYRPLAIAGNPEAQVNLGFMYDEGLGIPKDLAEAINWYRRAADQGEPQGQSNLAHMYRDGVGVAQDYVRAHQWLNLAAARFAESEKSKKAATDRDHVAARMTEDQIAEAQRLARHWKPTSEASAGGSGRGTPKIGGGKPETGGGWWEGVRRFFR